MTGRLLARLAAVIRGALRRPAPDTTPRCDAHGVPLTFRPAGDSFEPSLWVCPVDGCGVLSIAPGEFFAYRARVEDARKEARR